MEFVAKFGGLWGYPRKYKSHTSAGIEFGLVEGLSHELESVADRFIMSILRGRCGAANYHPVLSLINKTDFPWGKSDQNHVDKRILGGKGLQYEDSTSITFVRPVFEANINLGGGFKLFFIFIPLGEDSNFDQYFATGLKPPTISNCSFGVFLKHQHVSHRIHV